MKILVVCQYYYPENFVITNICEELVKKGHEVHVLTGLPNYGYDKILPEYKNIRYEEINGVKINRVKIVAKKHNKIKIILNYLTFWWNAKKWVKKCKEKYDIVFSMSLSPVTILAPANLYKKRFNVKHVCYCVDLWPESVLINKAVNKKSLMYRVLYKWSKSLYSKTDAIIVGSPSFKKYFNEVLNIKDTDMYTLVQPPLCYDSNEISKHDFDDKFHILYCGNIGRIQMVENIPIAMSKINNENVVFDIIGMGPKVDELKQNIKLYNQENRVIYHGSIPFKKSAPYFKGASCLYVSLKGDGYVGSTIPNKLVMSMGFKKPILAMLQGDGKDILIKSNGAVLVEEDILDLAKKIDQISMYDNGQLNDLANNNYSYFMDNLNMESFIVEFEKILLRYID